MGADDVWQASGASVLPTPTTGAGRKFAGGENPAVTVVMGEVLTDLMGNFAGWMKFGVGNLAFVFLSLLLIVPAYLVMVIPLVTNNDDSMMVPGMLLMTAAVFVVTALQLPWTNGQYRAMLRYQRGDATLEVTSPLAEATTNLGGVFALTAISFGISMLALLACYIPVFFVNALIGLAFPALVVHNLGALEAVALSIRHARQYPMWTLGFWGLGFGILMVGSQIPILGPMLTAPVYLAYQLRCYREIYGDGAAPIEAAT